MRGDLELHPGLVLADRYQLEVPLGQGGMGEVWRGVDLRLRRPVAIKFLPPHLASDQGTVARFRREAEITAGLQHPGITVMFDIEEQDRWLFLVMELLQGHDLSRVLADHPHGLPIEQAVTLAAQTADALAAAHSRGVVHRDIKPANLFLQEDGRVKICDFGIARLLDATALTGTGLSIGTPRYMAPEQFEGGLVDHRTDLYSLGCVLYELLTGRPVFSTEGGVSAAMYQHVTRSPAPPRSVRPEIPDHLDGLVRALLAKDPAHRPASAAVVAEMLRGPNGGSPGIRGTSEAAGTGDPGFAPTVSPSALSPDAGAATHPSVTRTDVPRPRRRRTGMIAVLAVVVAALVAVGGYLTLRGDSSPRKHSDQAAKASSGATKRPAPVTGPMISGWQLVRAVRHGVAYDVPPGWRVRTPDTELGYADANGNASQMMSGVADIPARGCTGDNLTYRVQTGVTGGTGVIATPSSTQWQQLEGTASMQASQWATGEYTHDGRVPSVDFGTVTKVVANGITAADATHNVVVNGSRDRCTAPRGVVHAVAIASAQGAPLVFIAIADRKVPVQVTDADLRKVISSIRPLG